MSNATARTCASLLVENWISRYGVPIDITSDHGPQFTSSLWKELAFILGFKVNTTSAYHPQSNGMVERWHRSFKQSLRAKLEEFDTTWTQQLPLVLLGLRTCWRENVGFSTAEALYGTKLVLPNEFMTGKVDYSSFATSAFVRDLGERMSKVPQKPVLYHGAVSYTHLTLPTNREV